MRSGKRAEEKQNSKNLFVVETDRYIFKISLTMAYNISKTEERNLTGLIVKIRSLILIRVGNYSQLCLERIK